MRCAYLKFLSSFFPGPFYVPSSFPLKLLQGRIIGTKIIWGHQVEKIKNLLPWYITDKHPVAIPVFIGRDIVGAVQKIHQLALIHEILKALGFTISFNISRTCQQLISSNKLHHSILYSHTHTIT